MGGFDASRVRVRVGVSIRVRVSIRAWVRVRSTVRVRRITAGVRVGFTVGVSVRP